jgi:hypothetical protein
MRYDSVAEFECEWGGPDESNYAVHVGFESGLCFLHIYQPRREEVQAITIECPDQSKIKEWLEQSAAIVNKKLLKELEP